MTAAGLAWGLAVYPEAGVEELARLVQAIGLFGLLLMIMAMVTGAPWLVGWATATLLTDYGLSLIGKAAIDVLAPVYAAALYLMVEAAYASLERRARIAGRSGRVLHEAGRLLILTVTAGSLAALVLVLASVPVAHGILIQVAGGAAAAAVLATLTLLVRQRA